MVYGVLQLIKYIALLVAIYHWRFKSAQCGILIVLWRLLALHDVMNPSLGVMLNGAVQHCFDFVFAELEFICSSSQESNEYDALFAWLDQRLNAF